MMTGSAYEVLTIDYPQQKDSLLLVESQVNI